MTTIAAIAAEHNMHPHELAAFLDRGRGFDYEKELDEEEAQNIINLPKYDQEHIH